MQIKVTKAFILVSVLTGCGSVKPDDAPVIISPSLLVACDKPVDLPSRDLAFTEVEVMWGRDRSALRECRDRHGGLAQAHGS